MIVGGVDLGGRKAAVAICEDGVLHHVADLVVPKTTRARELRTLGEWCYGYLKICDYVFIEEPLIGRGVRASLQVAQTAGAVMSALGGVLDAKTDFVTVASWKKAVVGTGNADKEMVKSWMQSSHPAYAALCGANQDRIDAACISLYGVQLLERASQLAAH